jgi:ubiquinone/menaquinone biosynthesis C-methylase UbiE
MSYYDQISGGYSELHGEEQMNKAKIILEKINPQPTETLLDVGCGDAAYLDLFGCKAVGLDPAKELLAKYKGRHRVMQGSAERLPFKDSQFDIVISITAVQNFTDIEKGLAEMRRVGRGRYAISVLKRSKKIDDIKRMISEIFTVTDVIEEEKDLIFFCRK